MLVDPVMERQQPDKKMFVSAGSSKTIPLDKRFIFVAGGSPATNLTMPNVSEAEHRKFTISATTIAATTGSVINIDYTDGGTLSSYSTTISTTGVELEFESLGRIWNITRGS